VVDIVGYRRNGHNELDDPRVTLPLSYQLIEQHPTVLEIYSKKLMVRAGDMLRSRVFTVLAVEVATNSLEMLKHQQL
jgi:2-oxoglutarate dehydrogenase E1 component